MWLKLIAFPLLAALLFVVTAQPPKNQPNIVIILADDLGQGDLGAFNPASKIQMPHVNRLAKEGMRFVDAHSGSAVCTPTRYGLLTGRYSFRSSMKRGVLQGYSPPLIDSGRTTIASLAQRAGYTTACIGKWHLGLDWKKKDPQQPLFVGEPMTPTHVNVEYAKPVAGVNRLGFDYSFVLPASLDMSPYCFVENGRVVNPQTRTIQGHDMSVRELFYRTGHISTDLNMTDFLPRFVREAVGFIDRNRNKPFLLYLPLSSPHTPWAIEEPFRGKSAIGPYGDFVQQTDHYVGQVMAALERNRLTDNTIVMFTSDNGSYWTEADIRESDHLSNNRLRGMKADIFEGGHRVPFVVRWPGHVQPNSRQTATVCLTDILATLADITRQPIPAGTAEDSYSLLPLLTPQKSSAFTRPFTIHHSGDGKFAIRQGDWKYVSSLGSGGFTTPKNVVPQPGGPTGQLYNLRNDPKEQTNLFGQKPGLVADLAKKLAVFEEIGR